MKRRRFLPGSVGGLLLTGLLACGGGSETGPDQKVMVYSGRNESLIGPLLELFTAETGVEVAVRYGGTAELAATLLEEGENTPAHLFISQDAAALGALSNAGRLLPLPEEVLGRVAREFRSAAGDWVGLSGRARTVVYNTEALSPDDLPTTLEEATDPAYKGRFGLAPTNGSFQAHMAAYQATEGREALTALLAGLVANEPRRYPKNSAIVEAVIAGEVDWGLVNHYYLWRALRESPGAAAENFFMPSGGANGFVNVAGIGLLTDLSGARQLVDFLLGVHAQSYFAEETFEYPLAGGVEAAAGLPALGSLAVGTVDFGQVASSLDDALSQIAESGLIH